MLRLTFNPGLVARKTYTSVEKTSFASGKQDLYDSSKNANCLTVKVNRQNNGHVRHFFPKKILPLSATQVAKQFPCLLLI